MYNVPNPGRMNAIIMIRLSLKDNAAERKRSGLFVLQFQQQQRSLAEQSITTLRQAGTFENVDGFADAVDVNTTHP